MNNRTETTTYAVLVALIAAAALLFLYNVVGVVAGSRGGEKTTIEWKDFGAEREEEKQRQMASVLQVFDDKDPFAPIITPKPTPTRPPTPTPPPTVPPCAVGWEVSTMTAKIVKIHPRGSKPQFVRLGDKVKGHDVVVKEIDFREGKVVVVCTDSGVEKTLQKKN